MIGQRSHRPSRPRPFTVRHGLTHGRQHGFSLIELMVAVLLSLLVILAAVAALIGAQSGYGNVDASTQLRENASFAVELIQRLAMQTGYQDITGTTITRENAVLTNPLINPAPDVIGYNNAIANPTILSNGTLANDSRNGATCPTSDPTRCANGSDVLVLRFYGINEQTPGATVGDGSMIDCAGNAVPPVSGNNLANRAYSVFYVDISASEPNLMCGYRDASGNWYAQPLVSGVESFQVLYGVDNVTTAGVVNQPETGTPTTWLTAAQMGTTPASYPAWRRVKRIRVGLLLRGPPNRAVDKAGTADTYYPLGYGSLNSNGSIGMGNATNDPGTALVTPADGRVRRVVSFTVYLRNPLDVCPPGHVDGGPKGCG